MKSSVLPFLILLSVLGCDSGSFRGRISQDIYRECAPENPDGGGGAMPCPFDDVCIEGRCYPACGGDAECGPGESCSSSGACVATGEMRDAGPPDVCDTVECTAPQVCHPGSGTCTPCSERTVAALVGEPGACADPTTVCDIANGACVAVAAAQCAPCNTDTECVDAATGFTGTCVTREVMGVREQVCVLPCTDTCSLGLACQDGRCIPPVGVPCTNWRAAVLMTPCLTDGACAPLGATSAVYPGACVGEDTVMVPPVNGRCAQPCGDTTHCWNAATQMCMGMGVELFCVPP